MSPWVIAAGAAVGIWGIARVLRKPTKSDYQTVTTMGPGGIPIKVATPVSDGVTVAQVTGQPSGPPTRGRVLPVPTTIPGKGVTYGPPGSVHPGGAGVLQLPPIIVTPSGSASVAVGSVLDVQRGLNTLGYCKPPLKEDGQLGPMTTACIKAFQSKNSLVVDGSAGPATKAAISAALTALAGSTSAAGATAQNSDPGSGVAVTPAGTTIDTTPALKWTVANVQHALNQLGTSPPLTEDNRIGPKTVAAVKSFQTANGLVPDGVAGPKTKTALYLAAMQASQRTALPYSLGETGT